MQLVSANAVLCIFIFFAVNLADCHRILLVFPFAAHSHFLLGNALAKGLAAAGHHTTLITPIQEKNPLKYQTGSYEEIVLTGFLEEKNKFAQNLFGRDKTWAVSQVPVLQMFSSYMVNQTLHHPNIQKLLNSNLTYDAVIVEQFNDDALKILAHHFNAPLILFSTIGANSWTNSLVGNPEPPSYIPDLFLGYSVPMTFSQRVKNTLFRIYSDLLREIYLYPTQNKLLRSAYPDAPDFNTLLYNVSLVFLNSHESISQPVPSVPNMVNIGGFHIEPAKKLPKDIQDFMDSAEYGVIYFSLGSNIVPSQMPKETLNVLLKVLGKVKQKVLWKWDEENLKNKPDNVKIAKWFPQRNILAHHNCKLFISHGGLLSTTETVHNGVPILAMPIFGDQALNAAQAQSFGYGISLPFSEITEEKFYASLKEILENPKYQENAKTRASIMNDRLTKPMDSIVYWVEYVIRHKGAPHLQVSAVDLPLFQYLLLDVILFLFIATLVIFILVSLCIKSLICRSKHKKVKKN